VIDGIFDDVEQNMEILYWKWANLIGARGSGVELPASREHFEDVVKGIRSMVPNENEWSIPSGSRPAVAENWSMEDTILRQARDHRNHGVSEDCILDYFKSATHVVEEFIADLKFHENKKVPALLNWRRAADAIETVLIRDWTQPDGSEAPGRPAVFPPDESKSLPLQVSGAKQRAAQTALVRTTSEKILAALFMAAGEGILLVDEDLEIVKANQRSGEIFGVLEQNLTGAHVGSLTDDSGAGELTRLFREQVEGERASTEITGIYVDGRPFPATFTVTRVDLEGKRYWPIIVQDNSDRKAMENRLREEKKQTEEINLTLKNVLKTIETDRKENESRLASRITSTLIPALKKVETVADPSIRKSYVALVREQLLSLASESDTAPDPSLLRLSKAEIEVCRLIRAGSSSKEICEAMNLSFETIQTHRKHIRDKLGLKGKKVNLHSFLASRCL
jgi:PAS domain S-box-containing protein